MIGRRMPEILALQELKYMSGDESEDVNRTKDASITSQVARLHIPQGRPTQIRKTLSSP